MSRRLYSFGPFHLDIGEQLLLRDGKALPLKPKAFDVLAVLVENNGRVVCKDELMKQVWADSFVEEGNLAVSIFEIRKALGENQNGHRYIETVPRRGYRFIASVTEAQITSKVEGSLGLAAARVFPSGSADSSTTNKGSIAVLPFRSIGGPGDAYLGLGMTDALITRLSNLRQITVRPISLVQKYSAAKKYQQLQLGLRNLPEFTACMGRIPTFSGRIKQALQALQALNSLKRLSETCYVQSNLIALVFTALGETDEAFRWLERAYEERDEDLCLLKIDPRFDSLRDDRRFQSLLERVGPGD